MSYSPLFRGASSKAPARSLQSGYQSGSGSTITKGSPVSVNASGQIILVDVTSETSVGRIVGLAALDIPSAANGQVQGVTGRLEDITTSFAIGDTVWIAKDGSLMNTRPDYGVSGFTSGDFVVFVGVVVKNEFDIMKKDIMVMINVEGQL